MPKTIARSVVAEILDHDQTAILDEWVRQILAGTRGSGSIKEQDLRDQCTKFLHLFAERVDEGSDDIAGSRWQEIRDLLEEISQSRAAQGFTTSETATFVFSLKQPLFQRLRKKVTDPALLATEIWNVTLILDKLGLFTAEVYLRSREEVIRRHQEEMLELSTPVIKLWHNILALPLIGTLDSARTQVVMETLLDTIVKTNCKVAIIDITGVPTVDTLVAQHLLQTVTAARLMGADCIISGIRPQIAQTIVHLGINLMDITTKATMADAFAVALQRTDQTLTAIDS